MDVIGIGLANIDLIASVPDKILSDFGLEKGQATKLSDLDFARLRAALPGFEAVAGGCAANTLCGLGGAGFRTRFYGKTGQDSFDYTFSKGFHPFGVLHTVKPGAGDTSQCGVLITPDGERTFAYMHGASWALNPDDIDMNDLWTAELVYAEIYAMAFGGHKPLWPFLVSHLRQSKVPLAMKVVDREYAALYRTAIFGLAEEGILTLLIGNADNLPAVAGVSTVAEAVAAFRKWKCIVLMTDGSKSAHYINGNFYREHMPIPIHTPVNASGAGDQFAAGFIEGFLQEQKVEDCLGLAERRAKDVLQVHNPRPVTHGFYQGRRD